MQPPQPLRLELEVVNQNPPAQPSLSGANFAGTLAGAIATMAVGAITHAGYTAAAAGFLCVPEATVSIVAMAVIGGAANYAVTHFASLKTLNDFYNMIPNIKTYPDYRGLGDR